MNRIEFLTELAILLKDIPAEERNEAMQYYNDYFQDAGYDKEKDIIAELGSPEKVAEEVKANLRISNDDTHEFRETGYTDTRFENRESLAESDPRFSEKESHTDTYEYTGGYRYNDEYSNVESPKSKRKHTGKLVLLILLILAIPLSLIILAIVAFGLVRNVTPVSESNAGLTLIDASYEGIRNIEVDANAIDLQIISTNETNDIVEVHNLDESDAVRFWQEEETLIVEVENESILSNESSSVNIYIPKGHFDTIDIDVDSGTVTIDELLSVGNLDVDIDAGEISIGSFHADFAELICNAGKIAASGTCNNDLSIECDAGEILFTLKGKQSSYNYEIECNVGEVILGEESYSGLGEKVYQTNNVSKNMDIECNVGKVIIDFTVE